MKFGTAGIPHSTKKPTTVTGIQRVRELKLDAMELEFVHSIYLKKEKTQEVKEIAKKNNITLTCHAPFYINLNSKEKEKIGASRSRIIQSAKIAHLCGAHSVTFHPGFYMEEESSKVYEKIKEQIKKIIKILKDDNIKIWVRPETTGKPTQFGSLDECIKLSKDISQVLPCVDFSHVHARSNGKYNTKKEFKEILIKYEKELGKKALQNMHIHLSGINYTKKGERNHLMLKDSDMNYKDLLKTLKEFKCKGVLIAETPNPEIDALLIKKTYSSL